MKKLLSVVLSLMLILSLAGCLEEKDTITPTETVVTTTHYSLTFPISWYNQYYYTLSEGNAYDLQVFNKTPDSDTKLEFLFSINMLKPEVIFTSYSNYQILGSLTLSDTEKYNLIVVFSKDLDADKKAEILEIIASIKFTNPGGFSTETIKDEAYKVIDTDYFTLKIPKNWADKVVIEEFIAPYNTCSSVSFKEVNEYELTQCGHLFTIYARPYDPNEEIFYPRYEILGEVTIKGEKHVVIALYPSDVQYSFENRAVYEELRDSIDDFLPNIILKNS